MRKFVWTILSFMDMIILIICFVTFQTQSGDGYLGLFIIYPELLIAIGIVRIILVKKHKVGFVYKFQEFLYVPFLLLSFFLHLNNEQIKIFGQIFTTIAFFICIALSIMVIFSEKKEDAK